MDPEFARGSNRQMEGFRLEIANAVVEMPGREIRRRVVAKQSGADMRQLIEEKELMTVSQKKPVVDDILRTLASAFRSSHTLFDPSARSKTNRRRPFSWRGMVSLGPGLCFGARW